MDTEFLQPSPVITDAFQAFRKALWAQTEYMHSTHYENDVALRLCNELTDCAFAIFDPRSASIADHIVKAYANLRWHASSPNNPSLDHVFDVDLASIDSDNVVTDSYYQQLYRDLDACDLGRCLLGLGLTVFTPAAWVEVADRSGMDVLVIVAPSGEKRLSMVSDADGDPVLEKQHDRLRRLASGRTAAIGEHILANRPSQVAYLRDAPRDVA